MDQKIAAAQELALVHGDPSQVTLPALMDLAVDAMYVDFRKLLEETAYTDVRPTHGCVFRFVHGDGMRLTELATQAGLTKQSVGEIVDDLTGLGYIERFPDPTDKRAKLIRLTAKGLDAQRIGFASFDQARRGLGGGLRRRPHRRPPRPPRRHRPGQIPRRRPRAASQPRTRSRPLIR